MISKKDVIKAQEIWGNGVVEIGSYADNRHVCEETTDEFIDALYDFDNADVLFKPTRAAKTQFRPTKKAAKSYFIGGDNEFSEDNGFAMHPWVNVRFENHAIKLEGNRAIAMGNYYFTDLDGNHTKVEYTFGYKKNAKGIIKIDLHHSSIPFAL